MSVYFVSLGGQGRVRARGGPRLGALWALQELLCLAGGPLSGQVPLPPVPEGVQL